MHGTPCATSARCTNASRLDSRPTRSSTAGTGSVTFLNGTVLRERVIDLDDDTRRLAWSIVDGPYPHHNGVAEVLADDDCGTVFQWTTDLLPDELAPRTSELMELGLQAIKRTLESVVGEASVSSDRSILRSEVGQVVLDDGVSETVNLNSRSLQHGGSDSSWRRGESSFPNAKGRP